MHKTCVMHTIYWLENLKRGDHSEKSWT